VRPARDFEIEECGSRGFGPTVIGKLVGHVVISWCGSRQCGACEERGPGRLGMGPRRFALLLSLRVQRPTLVIVGFCCAMAPPHMCLEYVAYIIFRYS
jgi:hypothetical protein